MTSLMIKSQHKSMCDCYLFFASKWVPKKYNFYRSISNVLSFSRVTWPSPVEI